MTFGLRDWTETDQEAVEDLWVEAWQNAMPEIDFAARQGWLRLHLARLRDAGARIIVAHDDAGPAGFVSVDGDGYVDQLAVSPAHQKRGLGVQLLEAARIHAGRPLSLSVNADNAGAIAFYRLQGFRESGRGINSSSGLPTLVMRQANAGLSR